MSNVASLTWNGNTFISRFQDSGTEIERAPVNMDLARAACVAAEEILGYTWLQDLPEQGYRLVRPLRLIVYRAPDYYWVAPEGFVLHGIGATIQEAVEDYGYALLDYYKDLLGQRDLLAPHLLEHLEYLETIVARG